MVLENVKPFFFNEEDKRLKKKTYFLNLDTCNVKKM